MNVEEMQAKFKGKRTLFLPSDIDRPKVDRIGDGILEFNFESGEDIKLLIDSGGGRTVPSFNLADLIMASKARVIGIVIGVCRSSAVTILQACHRRLSFPHSVFLVHSVRQEISFKISQTEKTVRLLVRDRIREGRIHQRNVEEMILRRSNMPRKKLRELMRNGDLFNSDLSAREALKLGLIDEIIDPSIISYIF